VQRNNLLDPEHLIHLVLRAAPVLARGAPDRPALVRNAHDPLACVAAGIQCNEPGVRQRLQVARQGGAIHFEQLGEGGHRRRPAAHQMGEQRELRQPQAGRREKSVVTLREPPCEFAQAVAGAAGDWGRGSRHGPRLVHMHLFAQVPAAFGAGKRT
jgi:hypothetical protein